MAPHPSRFPFAFRLSGGLYVLRKQRLGDVHHPFAALPPRVASVADAIRVPPRATHRLEQDPAMSSISPLTTASSRRQFLTLLGLSAVAVSCGTGGGGAAKDQTRTLRYQGWAGAVILPELAEDLGF